MPVGEFAASVERDLDKLLAVGVTGHDLRIILDHEQDSRIYADPGIRRILERLDTEDLLRAL